MAPGPVKEVKISLEEFAAARTPPRGVPCWTCALPEREILDAAKRRNDSGGPHQVPVRRMLEWLQEECGYGEAATWGRVTGHFQRGHHRKGER